jgi:hemerythrin-like domain-containing protein
MISQFMTTSHRDCDAAYAQAEVAAGDGNLAQAREAYARFEAAMTRHLAMEESVLFPEFEQRTGMTSGPTAVMRMEHGQIRALMAQMQQALAGGSLDDFLGAGDTLMILVQQHNMKEEHMLYPMSDRALADCAAAVLARMQAV